MLLGGKAATGDPGPLDENPWGMAAGYALGSSLTALWESLGILPVAVFGDGFGEITAAHAAGVLTLEEGMRLALVWGDPNAAYPVLEPRSPGIALLSGLTGEPVTVAEKLDGSYWRRLAQNPADIALFANSLRAQQVDVVISQGHASDSYGSLFAGPVRSPETGWPASLPG